MEVLRAASAVCVSCLAARCSPSTPLPALPFTQPEQRYALSLARAPYLMNHRLAGNTPSINVDPTPVIQLRPGVYVVSIRSQGSTLATKALHLDGPSGPASFVLEVRSSSLLSTQTDADLQRMIGPWKSRHYGSL